MTPEQTAAKLETMPPRLRRWADKFAQTDAYYLKTRGEVHQPTAGMAADMLWLADFIDQRIAAAKANGVAVVPKDKTELTLDQLRKIMMKPAGFFLFWCAWGGSLVVYMCGIINLATALTIAVLAIPVIGFASYYAALMVFRDGID